MRRDLAAHIDHSCLRADTVPQDVERLCAEAAQYDLRAVCVNSSHVRRCREMLEGGPVRIASTAGFPLGASGTPAKTAEVAQAVLDGADEIDVVCAIGDLKSGRRESFVDEIRRLVDAAEGRPVKVILETGLLTDDQTRRGASWVQLAGAAFVKTSTGFGPRGATVADVELLREVVGPGFGVKAAGGIRDASIADQLLAAGADLLGTSVGTAIVTESQTVIREYG